MTNAVEAARQYLAAGWAVVPVEPASKTPKIPDWPLLAASRAWQPEDFDGMNVGVVLGTTSGGLVDIDLDSAAAVALAPAFLPATLTFGRASKRASHWLYRASGVRSAMNFFAVEGGRELVEIRSTNASSDACGHQSVFPGSTHESGEPVEWDAGQAEEPANVDGAELVWRVARLTVASAILNTYEEGRGRNAQTMGYAGGLLKTGWTADEVREAFQAIREASGEDRAKDADAVERVIAAFEAGTDVTGFGSLKQDGVVPAPIVDAVERHAKTPEQRLRDVQLQATRPGLRARMLADARAVDGITAAADVVAGLGVAHDAQHADPGNDPYSLLGRRIDLRVEEPPLDYLIDELPFAPGGKVNALAGPPKGGKSPLAVLLAVCVCTGLPFLGRKVLRPGPVLYLDAETGKLARIRYRRICRALRLEPGSMPLEFRDVETAFTEEYVETLDAALRAEPRRLVIIDTYGAMLEAGIDYNSPEFAHWLKQLGRLSRAIDVTIVVLIHEKKTMGGKRPGNGLEMISGSYSAAGAMQASVSLRPEGEDNESPIVVSCSRAPEHDFKPFRIKWQDVAAPGADSPGQRLATDGKRWGLAVEIVEGEAELPLVEAIATKDEDVVRRIYGHLERGPSTLRQIRDAVAESFRKAGVGGIGRVRLDRLVDQLVRSGHLNALTQRRGSGEPITMFSRASE